MISRRSLLFAAPAILAAPAIVRAANLMAVKPIAELTLEDVMINVEPAKIERMGGFYWNINDAGPLYPWRKVGWEFKPETGRFEFYDRLQYAEIPACPPNPKSC